MKTFIPLILFFLSNFSIAQSGIKLGLNVSDYVVNGTNLSWNKNESIIAPYFGYFNDWNISRKSNNESYFSLGYEVCLSAKGSILNNFITYSEQTPFDIIDTSKVKKFFYYVELPHLVKFHYSLTQNIKLEIEAGGAISLLVAYGTKTLEHSNPNYSRNETYFFFVPNLGEIPTSFIEYSLVGGLGINYNDYLFNFRFTRGLINVYPNTSLQTLTFSVGYKLGE